MWFGLHLLTLATVVCGIYETKATCFCKNGGAVKITNAAESDAITCECLTGFDGKTCEKYCSTPTNCGAVPDSANDCVSASDPNPCQNGGTATFDKYNMVFVCACAAGFYGPTCRGTYTNYNTCPNTVNPCLNGGTIAFNAAGYECKCANGYFGTRCQDVCINAGNQVYSNGCWTSLCKNDYYKKQCRRFCGICQPPTSADLVEKTQNHCVTENPCKNGGTFSFDISTKSLICACTSGFFGPLCQATYFDKETMATCTAQFCKNGGTVKITNAAESDAITCECLPGFDGKTCEKYCSTPSNCGTVADSATGKYCVSASDPNPCQNGGTAKFDKYNMVFVCACPAGFFGPTCRGTYTNYNTCPNTVNPCLNGGTIAFNAAGYECKCANGYFGTRCQDVCINAGNQVYSNGCWTSLCKNDYYKKQCRRFCGICQPPTSADLVEKTQNHCVTENPCKNGGTFSFDISTKSLICACTSGFFGPLCQATYSDKETMATCTAQICKNGGAVKTTNAAETDAITCECLPGFDGKTCEKYCSTPANCGAVSDSATGKYCLSAIDPNPCQNGGTATSDKYNMVFVCACAAGFYGPTCQGTYTNYNTCPNTVNQCLNGGTIAFNNAGGYQCTCANGYLGTRCENVCINAGNQVYSNGCWTSLCKNDYYKKQCKRFCGLCQAPTSADLVVKTQNHCVTENPCQNGGTLNEVKTDNSYRCTCTSEYSGLSCNLLKSSAEDCLAENPCFNGGTYVFKKKTDGSYDSAKYTCNCLTGYGGDRCLSITGTVSGSPGTAAVCIPNENPCQNGARLEVMTTMKYYCHCTAGFHGQYCENLNGVLGEKVTLTEAQRNKIVEVTNELRRKIAKGEENDKIQPPAADMKYLEYSMNIEAKAMENAEQCNFAHSGWYFWNNGYAGENLWMTSAIISNANIIEKLESALRSWYSEQKNFIFGQNGTSSQCAADCVADANNIVRHVDKAACLASGCAADKCKDKVCGHYTYQMRQNFDFVGCGVARCSNRRDKTGKLLGSQGTIIACGFGPSWGSEMYTVGTACSKCPTTHNKCDDGLCKKP